MSETASDTMRIDKWLVVARFFKTRTESARIITAGHLRLDGKTMTKPHRQIRPNHILSFAKGSVVRVIRVVALAERRGPASLAQTLYEDLAPIATQPRTERITARPFERRDAGTGRPTKRERRQIDHLKG